MKNKYIHTHPYLCPSLITLQGQKYLLPDWIKVDLKVTLDDIIWIK